MIDTVVLAYNIKVDNQLLAFWDRVDTKMANGSRIVKFQLNFNLDNGATVTNTYRPYSIEGHPHLSMELSIPKIILGNNYTMVVDIDGAIPRINNSLARIVGLPLIDVRDGILCCVDACYNHQVGDAVPFFVKALQSLAFPYRKTKPYSDEGVQYLNKQASTKFYDKEKECGDPSAYGILRQETTLRREAVKKLTGKERPTLLDITPKLLASKLEKDLDELGILGRSIGTKDTTLQVLSKTYGELAGVFYYGLLHAKTTLTKEMVATATNSHPRSLDRRLQRIAGAGIPLTLTETVAPLPPLVIDLALFQLSKGLVSKNVQ